MKHARDDYNRIQDPAGLIPDDEPVFLIRGQDKVGALTVKYWAELAKCAGASPEIVQAAMDQADRMRAYQSTRCKVPDMPHNAAGNRLALQDQSELTGLLGV